MPRRKRDEPEVEPEAPKKKASKAKKRKVSRCTPCDDEEKMRNLVTKRCIKKMGPAHKKACREGQLDEDQARKMNCDAIKPKRKTKKSGSRKVSKNSQGKMVATKRARKQKKASSSRRESKDWEGVTIPLRDAAGNEVASIKKGRKRSGSKSRSGSVSRSLSKTKSESVSKSSSKSGSKKKSTKRAKLTPEEKRVRAKEGRIRRKKEKKDLDTYNELRFFFEDNKKKPSDLTKEEWEDRKQQYKELDDNYNADLEKEAQKTRKKLKL